MRLIGESPGAALNVIEQIRGGADLRLNWSNVRMLIAALTLRQNYVVHNVHEGFGLNFVRGRVGDSKSQFSNIRQLSFRDPKDVIDYGRCHKPGSSMFYASLNLETVFSELEPNAGDRVHIALARIKPEPEVNITAIGEFDYVRRHRRPLFSGDEMPRPIVELLGNTNSPLNLKRVITDAFFADLFIRRADSPNHYKATSALSDILISYESTGDPRIEGLAYPSVGHRGGKNFAITPEAFTNKMEIYECQVHEIGGYWGFGIYTSRLVLQSASIAENGDIQWVEPPPRSTPSTSAPSASAPA